MKIISSFLIISVLSGCSLFTPEMENPVIENALGPSFWTKRENIGTLALTPERRIVLVNFYNKRFCAEAPTEVSLDLSKIINASGSANANTSGNIALGLLVDSNSGNSILNKRSQAVQLFLANSYYTCQMYMNGAISGEQMVEVQLKTLNQIAEILITELPLLYNSTAPKAAPKIDKIDVNRAIKDIFKSKLKTSNQEQSEKRLEQIRE